MTSNKERFDRVKEKVEEKEQLKGKLKLELQFIQTQVSEGREQLQEEGIVFDTVEELKAFKDEKSQRVSQLLDHMEQTLDTE